MPTCGINVEVKHDMSFLSALPSKQSLLDRSLPALESLRVCDCPKCLGD